jgi:hypothetical protein
MSAAGIENHILELATAKYQKLCEILENRFPEAADLTFFKDEPSCTIINDTCADLFSEEITQIVKILDNPNIGIVALDIPESDSVSKIKNGIYGAAVIMGIFNKIGIPNFDSLNKMPFAVHTASHSNAVQLDSHGLDHYTPEVKLGFHNDGLLSSDKIEIPEHIVVYNFYISYKRPGNFLWVPTSAWVEAEKYFEHSQKEKKCVKIRVTPSFYLDENKKIQNSVFDFVEAPVSLLKENGDIRFFLNGQVRKEDNTEEDVAFIHSLRESIQNNPQIIKIPQRERRAIFLKNTKGFHARDVFEEPIDGVDLTRVFLRMVDLNAEIFSTH